MEDGLSMAKLHVQLWISKLWGKCGRAVTFMPFLLPDWKGDAWTDLLPLLLLHTYRFDQGMLVLAKFVIWPYCTCFIRENRCVIFKVLLIFL